MSEQQFIRNTAPTLAGIARKALEERTGKPVITAKNADANIERAHPLRQ